MVPPNNLGPDLNGKAMQHGQEKHFKRLSVARSQTYVLNAKKQQFVAEAEYVAAAECCANILWMKNQFTNYDIIYEKVPIFCDNTRDSELYFIPTQYQLANIFTKPLDEPTFKRLIVELGTPIPYDPAPQVDYDPELINFKANNEVTLLYPDHPNKEHFKVVSDFSSKCCLREAFTRTPTQYKEYLVEFWYIAKVLKDSTKVWFSTPTGGIKGEVGVTSFRNAIGANYLAYSKDYDALHSIKTVKEWFLTIGYSGIIEATCTLKKGLLPPRKKSTSSSTIYNPLSKIEANKSVSLLKEATESPTGHSKKKKQSGLAKDTNINQPLACTPVFAGMHKEVQQATSGLTSLGVTCKVRVDPQLSNSTVEDDPGKSAPNDFLSKQQGNDKGTQKYSIDNIIAGTNPDVLEASYDQEEFNTYLELTSSNDAKEIKLEDRSNLVKDVGIDLMDMDSLEDD
ncbi:hypothetical protein Tco_1391686 [Tanacetum coccineum]